MEKIKISNLLTAGQVKRTSYFQIIQDGKNHKVLADNVLFKSDSNLNMLGNYNFLGVVHYNNPDWDPEAGDLPLDSTYQIATLGDIPYSTQDLEDIDSESSPEESEILYFTGGRYIPSILSLNLLKDVDLGDLIPKVGSMLVSDEDGIFKRVAKGDLLSLRDLKDVSDLLEFPDISMGLLSYDSNLSEWRPVPRRDIGASIPLLELKDVDEGLNTLSDGDSLVFSSSRNLWLTGKSRFDESLDYTTSGDWSNTGKHTFTQPITSSTPTEKFHLSTVEYVDNLFRSLSNGKYEVFTDAEDLNLWLDIEGQDGYPILDVGTKIIISEDTIPGTSDEKGEYLVLDNIQNSDSTKWDFDTDGSLNLLKLSPSDIIEAPVDNGFYARRNAGWWSIENYLKTTNFLDTESINGSWETLGGWINGGDWEFNGEVYLRNKVDFLDRTKFFGVTSFEDYVSFDGKSFKLPSSSDSLGSEMDFRFNTDLGIPQYYFSGTWNSLFAGMSDLSEYLNSEPNLVISTSWEFTRNLNLTSKGYLKLPSGTQSERPTYPTQGMIRYCTDIVNPDSSIGRYEIYNPITTNWEGVSGLQTEQDYTITGNWEFQKGLKFKLISDYDYLDTDKSKRLRFNSGGSTEIHGVREINLLVDGNNVASVSSEGVDISLPVGNLEEGWLHVPSKAQDIDPGIPGRVRYSDGDLEVDSGSDWESVVYDVPSGSEYTYARTNKNWTTNPHFETGKLGDILFSSRSLSLDTEPLIEFYPQKVRILKELEGTSLTLSERVLAGEVVSKIGSRVLGLNSNDRGFFSTEIPTDNSVSWNSGMLAYNSLTDVGGFGFHRSAGTENVVLRVGLGSAWMNDYLMEISTSGFNFMKSISVAGSGEFSGTVSVAEPTLGSHAINLDYFNGKTGKSSSSFNVTLPSQTIDLLTGRVDLNCSTDSIITLDSGVEGYKYSVVINNIGVNTVSFSNLSTDDKIPVMVSYDSVDYLEIKCLEIKGDMRYIVTEFVKNLI